MKFDVNCDIGHGGCGGFDGISDKVAPKAVAVAVSGALGREGLWDGGRGGKEEEKERR